MWNEYLTKLKDEAAEAKHRQLVLKKNVITRMPTTRRELIAYGCSFTGRGDCCECQAQSSGGRHSRQGTHNCMDGDAEASAMSHFATRTRA